MIRRHVVEALTKLIIRRGVQFSTTNVRVVAYPQVQLIQLARVNTCSILPKQLSYMDMQAPCGVETDPLFEIDIPMVHDAHGLSSSTSLPSVDAVPEDGASTSVLIDASNEKEKSKRAKKKVRKPRGRKKKPKVLEGIDDLMAELPFAGTEFWKDLEFATSERLKKKRKLGESAESEEDAEKEKKKKKKQPTNRPNYFVSIPITNPEIRAGVEAVQAAVIQRDPRLSRALIPPASLHITLLVTHLESQEQVHAAACALEQSRRGVCEALGGEEVELLLPFSGVTSFRNEVAFIQLAPGEHCSRLTHLAEAVRRTFVERGIAVTEDKGFKPHLTFMKLSRAPKLRSQGIKKLDPELYSEFCDQAFGCERVSSIDLCSMLKKKGPDGYFHREKTITFDLSQTARRVSRTSARKPADEEELARVSRRVVDEAVQRAVQQYLEETQHSNGDAPPPKEASSPNANTNTPNTTTTTTVPSSTSPTATQQQQQPPTINVNANK